MEANKTWTVIIETPSGLEKVVVIRYPRRPTNDLAAGLVRLQLGLDPVSECRKHEDAASLKALEEDGYQLLTIEQPTEN